MKFSAQEEYGLRCLLQIGHSEKSITIPEISKIEGITTHNVAKILRILRRGGFIESVRGHTGGYTLARAPEKIIIGEVLAFLGGRLFDLSFCTRYAGTSSLCAHSTNCSIRSLWKNIQSIVDSVLSQTTLKDLLGSETEQDSRLNDITAPFSAVEKLVSTQGAPSGCAIHELKVEQKLSS